MLHLGEICLQLADDGKAREYFEQCLALARSIKHSELEIECERNLGELALRTGDIPAAQARFARSLKVCRDAENKRDEAAALWCLGKTDVATGDYASARGRLAEALRAFEAFEMNSEALYCLEDYAIFLLALGKADGAARLQAATTAMRQALMLPRSPRDEPKRKANLDAARAALGAATFDAAWAEGQKWAFDDAIEYALDAASESTVPTASLVSA